MKKVLLGLIILAIAITTFSVSFEKFSVRTTFEPIPVFEGDTSHPERKGLSINDARRIARGVAKEAGIWSLDKLDVHDLIASRDEPDHIHVYWYDSSSVILVVQANELTFLMTPEQAIATEWPNDSFIKEYINLVKDEGVAPEPIPVIMPY